MNDAEQSQINEQNEEPGGQEPENEKDEKEESSPVTEVFTAIGLGISRSAILCAVVAVLIVAGYFLTNPQMGSWRLAAFLALLFVALIALLIFLFKRGTGEQKQEVRKTLELPVKVTANTLELATRLPQDAKDIIRQALKGAASDTAQKLSLPENLVRANIFGVDNHKTMRIIPGFTYNMNRPEELTVAIPVGYGSTGISFAQENPHVAVFRKDWGKSVIADHELKKVHPELRWIISIPVVLTAESGETEAVWTLNVDGLTEQKTEKQLECAVPDLLRYSGLISYIINTSVGRNKL